MTKKKEAKDTTKVVPTSSGVTIETTVGDLEQIAKYGKRMKMENQYLPCEFTEEEMQKKAGEMANKLRERTTLNNEKLRALANFSSQIKSMDGEIAKLSSDYSAGYEYRNVKCDVFIDYKDNIKRWVRSDTGAVAKESKLTLEDMQMEFPSEAAKPAEDKPADESGK